MTDSWEKIKEVMEDIDRDLPDASSNEKIKILGLVIINQFLSEISRTMETTH